MDIITIREYCNSLPCVTEDIKWKNDLCFMVDSKMFCVLTLNYPLKISFKVTDDEFNELTELHGIIPAPYGARFNWIQVNNLTIFNKEKWEFYIKSSYSLVLNKTTLKKHAK